MAHVISVLKNEAPTNSCQKAISYIVIQKSGKKLVPIAEKYERSKNNFCFEIGLLSDLKMGKVITKKTGRDCINVINPSTVTTMGYF